MEIVYECMAYPYILRIIIKTRWAPAFFHIIFFIVIQPSDEVDDENAEDDHVGGKRGGGDGMKMMGMLYLELCVYVLDHRV